MTSHGHLYDGFDGPCVTCGEHPVLPTNTPAIVDGVCQCSQDNPHYNVPVPYGDGAAHHSRTTGRTIKVTADEGADE